MSNWKTQSERGNRFFITLLSWLVLTLGRTLAGVLLAPIALYFLLFSPRAVAASRNYLRRVLNSPPGLIDCYRHFYTFARVSVDRIYLLAGKIDLFSVEVRNDQLFRELIASGKGALLLVSHFGSFEIMRVLASQQYPVTIRIVIDIQHNANTLALFNKLNPSLAANVIDARLPPAQLALSIKEAIEQGDLVGIMADRVGRGEATFTASLLGEQVQFPNGPWLFSYLLKAPVIACFGHYLGKNCYDLRFYAIELDYSASRARREAMLSQRVTEYATLLETQLCHSPYNWFNFYDYWAMPGPETCQQDEKS